MFLQSFFEQRQALKDANYSNEIAVCCPFKHTSGYEKNASAHINTDKELFHCKTCRAEGRFHDGGLNTLQFVKEYFGMNHKTATKFIESLDCINEVQAGSWYDGVVNLQKSPIKKDVLINRRGFTEETIKQYELAYVGDGVRHPVKMFGVLCDIRTYDPDSSPKVKSEKGAQPLIYPFDHWYNDKRPTVLVGGENDALIGRQIGLNAITFTAGEGSLPRNGLLHFFNGKKVYVCYDCDEVGKQAAKRTAYFLKKHGADVYIVDLGLEGNKADKDLSDYVNKHDKGYADFEQLMLVAEPLSDEIFLTEKNREFPLVDLWNASDAEHVGKLISSRVIAAGKYDQDFHVPSEVQWSCGSYDGDSDKCRSCPMARVKEEDGIRSFTWTGDNHPKTFMKIVEQDEKQQLPVLKVAAHIPKKCDFPWSSIKSYTRVQKYIFTPDANTNHELTDFRAVEQYAYVLDNVIEDSDRYRIYFRAYPNPNQKGRVYLLVEEIEQSDTSVASFKVTEPIKEMLDQFKGTPDQVMENRRNLAKVVVGSFARDMVVDAVNLMYHSPLRFKYMGNSVKGYPEIGIIGETRTGKSRVSTDLMGYYNMGSRSVMKGATEAGVLGGFDKSTNGAYRIKWGDVVQNNKGLLILDEISGISQKVIASLTDVRSEGVATITRIGGVVRAPAATRLLWMGNQRTEGGISIPFANYPHGISIVLDSFGAAEDIARFDALMLIEDNGDRIKPSHRPDYIPPSKEACNNLVQWAWSRKADQVKFAPKIEDYIWDASEELNKEYNCSVKLFGNEAHLKVARLSVAIAATCFSSDESGECIVVDREHVDWTVAFLHRCYDNEIFRLKDFVKNERMKSEVTQAVKDTVKTLMHSPHNTIIIQELMTASGHVNRTALFDMSGLPKDNYQAVMAEMAKHHLIQHNAYGVSATLRFKKAYRLLQGEVEQEPVKEPFHVLKL